MAALYDYSPQQLQKMQQEAAERVRQMQRIARERLERTAAAAPVLSPPGSSPGSPPGAFSSPNPSPPPQNQPPAQTESRPGIDRDRLLILMLIFLLSSDGTCSPGLLAALFWLLG